MYVESWCFRCCVPKCLYFCRTLKLFLEVYTSSCQDKINSSQKSCTHTCQLNIINVSCLVVTTFRGHFNFFSKMYQIRTWIMLRLSEQQYESGYNVHLVSPQTITILFYFLNCNSLFSLPFYFDYSVVRPVVQCLDAEGYRENW